MKAVGYRKSLPIGDPESLLDLEIEAPQPRPRDLLVEIKAVSVNPVDTKVRKRAEPPAGEAKILGYDAAGIVKAVGKEVTLFRPGDEVFYAGSIDRPGTNAELHAVDERIAGAKPARLSFAEAAALPLTAITAWELLFDRFAVKRGAGGTLLVIGGAGGVGSILIQLARKLTALTVIATASRPQTRDWCSDLGAHHVIDHTRPLAGELTRIGIPSVDLVAGLTATEKHFGGLFEIINPQGKFGLIDDPSSLDILPLKRKSISVHWEYMFVRPVYQTGDMIEQHRLLSEVGALADAGTLRTTLGRNFGPQNAANLRAAHALVESGASIGKAVLEGF